MYQPKEKDGKWYAETDHTDRLTGNRVKVLFKDFNNELLEFHDEAHARQWCVTRNEIDKLC